MKQFSNIIIIFAARNRKGLMSTIKQQRNGHLALLGSNVMWGVMAPISKFVLAGGIISSMALVDIRIFGGTILFWIASMFFGSEKVDRKDYIKLFGAGFFSTTALTSPIRLSALKSRQKNASACPITSFAFSGLFS